MKMNKKILAGLLALPALFFAPNGSATPVTGFANIIGNVDVSGNSINFMPAFSNGGALERDDFAGLTGGSIKSLLNGPVTGATFVPTFVSFTDGLAAPIYFDLTYIAPGVGTVANCSSSALGAICTPAGSPFTLFQLPSNTVIATLQLNGNLYAGSTASGVSPAASVFTTQTVLNGTIPEIVNLLASGQSLTGITYSASFLASSAVPEPSAMALLSIGLIGATLIVRQQNRG